MQVLSRTTERKQGPSDCAVRLRTRSPCGLRSERVVTRLPAQRDGSGTLSRSAACLQDVGPASPPEQVLVVTTGRCVIRLSDCRRGV